MVTFTDIQTQEEVDFNRGYDCYRNGDEVLYNVNADVKEGYREAWYEDNRSRYRNSDNAIDEAWEGHWDTIKEISTIQ